jgi:pSer/pThr/pTyr-binding forkhead associated (FHA) protein
MKILKLPKNEILFSQRPYSPRAINSLFTLVKNRSAPIGLTLFAEFSNTELILFILENKPFAAARLQGDRFEPLTLREFFSQLSQAGDPLLTLNAVNPVLFKCLLIASQKAPSTSGTTDLINPEALLEKVKTAKKESVVAVKTDDALSFFYFSDGKLSEVCLADPPGDGSDNPLDDQFLEYVYTSSSDAQVMLQTYEDTEIHPARDQDLDWEESKEGVVDYFLRPRPELVFLSGGAVTKKSIDRKTFSLGRGQENDVMIPDIKASREHAVIRESNGQFLLEDLNSRNGTLVNNKPVTKVVLVDGDEINIGKTRILFTIQSRTSPQIRTSADLQLENTQVGQTNPAMEIGGKELSLTLMNGPQKGLIIPLGKKLLIGRSKSDLNINDSKVSRSHASIEFKNNGYCFTDLGSTNGSIINNQPAKTQVLRPGDVIKLGETLLQVTERESLP